MNLKNYFTLAAASALLFTVSCRNDNEVASPKGDYQNGILMSNEGNYGKPNAEVSWVSTDLSSVKNDIYKTVNNENLGDVLNSVSFNGDNAYLVVNNSNKVVVANRYTLKKEKEINVTQPRYVALTNNKMYVTTNDFYSKRQLNIFEKDQLSKTIDFERFAGKITAQAGFVYIQTDEAKYDAKYNASPTGHTITRVNANTDNVDKTITLTDDGIIKDMASNNGIVYVLTSTGKASYIYKIDATSGNFTQPILVSSALDKMSIDNGQVYFVGSGAIYNLSNNTANKLFDVQGYIYGFNVIDGKVYLSKPDFKSNTDVDIYSTTGTLLKTFKAGMGTNAFYKN